MGFRGLPPLEEREGVRIRRARSLRRKEFSCSAAEAATYIVSARRLLARVEECRRPDVTHAHFIFPDGLLAMWLRRRTGIPYVITAHGSDVPGYNPHRLKILHRLLKPLWRRVVLGASSIICPSEHLRSLVLEAEPRARTEKIPYGFDLGRFSPLEGRPRLKRILTVTRMLERKGVQHLLEAVRSLQLDHEVHVVGDGPFLPALRSMAPGSRTPVKFWGWVENPSPCLDELYATSSIFVLPSEAENFPVALLEAMAAGLAIVTTRDTGCAEVVGDAALLVEARSPAAVRDAVLSLVEDPGLCASLGARARSRLEESFGWPQVARRHLEVYEAAVRQAAEARQARGDAP
jgi:glycosyltransferase involved in cell wall biosynthesis